MTLNLIASLSAAVVALVALWGVYTAVRTRPLDSLRKELSDKFDASVELLRTEFSTSSELFLREIDGIKAEVSSIRRDIVSVRESIARVETALPHLEHRISRLEE